MHYLFAVLSLAIVAVPASLGYEAKVFDVTSFGAVPDGRALNTKAFASAIEAGVSYVNGAPHPGAYQGIISVPKAAGPGFLIGSLNFSSYLTLRVDSGAKLLASTDPNDYVVTGAGTIDGQGWPWYSRFANHTLQAGRPHVLECMDCTDFSILGDGPQSDQMLRIVDSPFWTVHPYATDGVTIRYLNISNDPRTDALGGRVAPNTDGLDPDSSQNVLIDSCVLTTGDDGVAIKSGFNNAGLKFNRPTKNVLVHNVTVNNDCCNGFCIGSETSGGIENIVFDSCTSLGSPGSAFNIKSAAGRGAYVRNVTFVNSFVGGASNGISIDEHYGGGCVEPACNSSAIPEVSGITFRNIYMVDNQTQLSRTAGTFLGISGVGSPGFIRDLKVEQVSLRARDGSAWQCQDTQGVSVHDVTPGGLTSACNGHD